MAAHLYHLRSTWTLPAKLDQVWRVVADPDMDAPSWWVGCEFAGPVQRSKNADSQEELLLSTTAPLRFNSALGYSLTVSLHPTFVSAPHELRFEALGDLQGTGSFHLEPLGPLPTSAFTRMEIHWNVSPTRRWMRLLSPLARKAFIGAHAELMRRGELGLQKFLDGHPTI